MSSSTLLSHQGTFIIASQTTSEFREFVDSLTLSPEKFYTHSSEKIINSITKIFLMTFQIELILFALILDLKQGVVARVTRLKC
jgi:hypothetical protein